MHWDLASEHLKPKFARFGCLAPKSGRPDANGSFFVVFILFLLYFDRLFFLKKCVIIKTLFAMLSEILLSPMIFHFSKYN